MPVALRGAAVVPTGNPTTGFTVTIPSAVLTGDLLFLALTSRDSTGAGTLSVTDNDTGGNTWTKIGNSTDHKATLWYKRATSATASKTITVANAVGSTAGVLKCFSGGDSGATPYTNIVVETNASGNETHAGFTPANAGSMVCCSVHNFDNDNAVTSLSFATLGATTATEKTSTGGSDCGCIFGHALQSGGPSGTGNLTWAQTDGNTYSITWAIKPAVAISIVAAQGAIALSGQTVATRWNRRMPITAGAFTLTGNAVSLPAKITDNLISHWKFHEASNTTRNDSYGTNHATMSGTGVTQIAGETGNAARFQESGYLRVPDNPSLTPLVNGLGGMVKFRYNASRTLQFPAIMGQWATGQRSWSLRWNITLDRYIFSVSEDDSTFVNVAADAFGAPATGVWHTIRFWFDPSAPTTERIGIQVNLGTKNFATYTPETINNSTADLEFGHFGTSGDTIFGDIDWAYLWTRDPGDAIAAQIYNSGAGFEIASPIAYAGLDQVRLEQESVMLDSSRSVDDVAITDRTWSQLSGPSVTLSDDTAVNPTFTAPDISVATDLVFKVVVENALAQTAEDQVTITIQPIGYTGWLHYAPQEAGFDPAAFYQAMDAMFTPGMIFRNGRIVGWKGSLTATGYIWSSAKSFTACIFGARDHISPITLSDTVPDSDVPTSPLATVEQFLAMTSDFGLDQPSHSPGDHFAYNNAACHHFGTWLKDTFYPTRNHAETIEDAFATAIGFEDPVVYEATTFAGDNHMSGWNGGWSVSMRDLGRWAKLLLQDGVWDGTRIFSTQFMTEIWTPQIPAPATQSTDEDDQFFNQEVTSAQMKPAWTWGFWRADQRIPPRETQTEVLLSSGAYGTMIYMSRIKNIGVLCLNVGGTVTNDNSVVLNGSTVDAVLAAASNTYMLSASPGTFTESGQATGLTRSLRGTLEQGGFTETGNDVSLTSERQMIGSTGTFSETGNSASLLTGRKSSLDTGSFALTGNSANLPRTLKSVLEFAAFTVSGNSATLRVDRLLSLATGAIDLSGNDIALVKTGALSLEIETGSFTQSGQAMNLLRAHVLPAESETLSLSGNTLSFLGGFRIALDTGSLAQSGFELNLIAVRLLALDAGVFIETGQDVTLTRTNRLTIESGSFLEAGFTLSLLRSQRVPIGTGSFVQSGFEVAFPRGRALPVATGTFTEDGQAINTLATRILAGTTGGLNLTGHQVTLTHAVALTLIASGGSLLLSGQNAELRLARLLPIEGGPFVVSGSEVGLRADRVLAADGNYLITGSPLGLRIDRTISIDQGAFLLAGSEITLIPVHLLSIGVGQFTSTGYTIVFSYSGLDLSNQPTAIITVMAKPIATISVQSKPSAVITKWPS